MTIPSPARSLQNRTHKTHNDDVPYTLSSSSLYRPKSRGAATKNVLSPPPPFSPPTAEGVVQPEGALEDDSPEAFDAGETATADAEVAASGIDGGDGYDGGEVATEVAAAAGAPGPYGPRVTVSTLEAWGVCWGRGREGWVAGLSLELSATLQRSVLKTFPRPVQFAFRNAVFDIHRPPERDHPTNARTSRKNLMLFPLYTSLP